MFHATCRSGDLKLSYFQVYLRLKKLLKSDMTSPKIINSFSRFVLVNWVQTCKVLLKNFQPIGYKNFSLPKFCDMVKHELTRRFELVTRGCAERVTRGFQPVTCEFELITGNSYLVFYFFMKFSWGYDL